MVHHTSRYSIIVMGGSLVGKNSLCQAAAEHYGGGTSSTISGNNNSEKGGSKNASSLHNNNVTTITLDMNNHKYILELVMFYDTGFTGGEQNFVNSADGFLVVFDVTNKFSLERAKVYYKKILSIRGLVASGLGSGLLTVNTSGSTSPRMGASPPKSASPLDSPSSSSGTGNNSNGSNSTSPVAPLVPMVLIGNKCDVSEEERQVKTIEGIKLADSMQCPFFETSAMNLKGVDNAFKELLRAIDKEKRAQQLRSNAHLFVENTNSGGGIFGFLNSVPESNSRDGGNSLYEAHLELAKRRRASTRPTTSHTGT